MVACSLWLTIGRVTDTFWDRLCTNSGALSVAYLGNALNIDPVTPVVGIFACTNKVSTGLGIIEYDCCAYGFTNTLTGVIVSRQLKTYNFAGFLATGCDFKTSLILVITVSN